jgi:DNA polymerase-3 subunit delta'
MGFSSLLGQPTVVQTLTRALTEGHVAHAYRFEGPDGVGKELAARLLAQALVCEAGDPLGCERCSACRRAMTLSAEAPQVPQHPDVLFVQRGLYPASVLGTGHSEATGISVEQIRRIVLSRVGYAPHEGRALCIIVRDAHELTLSAANALLKTLEEPAPRTHFLLLTHRPRRLLDTIRSRTLAVRFRPLPENVVGDLLEARGAPRAVAPFAGGSVSLGMQLAEEEAQAQRERFVSAVEAAVQAPDLAQALPAADERPEGRDALLAMLGHLAHTYALRARSAVSEASDRAERLAERYGIVTRAVAEIERNGQPALVLEAMLTRLRRT